MPPEIGLEVPRDLEFLKVMLEVKQVMLACKKGPYLKIGPRFQEIRVFVKMTVTRSFSIFLRSIFSTIMLKFFLRLPWPLKSGRRGVAPKRFDILSDQNLY